MPPWWRPIRSRSPFLLDEPRFADARSKERARDFVGAADAVHAVIADDSSKCRAAYVEGRLRALAQDGPGRGGGVRIARRSRRARSRRTRRFARRKRGDAKAKPTKRSRGATTALAATDAIVFADDASLVLAEATDAKGDHAKALAIWRASIAKHAKGSRWVDTSVRNRERAARRRRWRCRDEGTRGARRGDARRDRSAAARGDLGREQSACASAFAPARCAEGFERGRAHAPRAGVARRIEAADARKEAEAA